MDRINSSQLLIGVLFLLLPVGCTSQDPASQDAPIGSSSAADAALTAADLERFLAVVQNHSEALIPEFTPPDEDESIDLEAPAEKLVESFRGEVRRLFDTARQGALWERDRQWSQALGGQKLSGERFASLVRKVSLAIMRVRLDSRVDIDQLVAQARRQVARTTHGLDEIDAVPEGDRTRESSELRANSVEKLGKAVALLEFAEMVRKVPADSTVVIRKYSGKLKALLPPHANDELLAELKELARPRPAQAQQAVYDAAEDDDEDQSAQD